MNNYLNDPGRLPFNKPFIVGRELEYIKQAINENGHLAGNGSFTKKCQAWLETHFLVPKVLMTNSCTAALEMAAVLCDIQPGDEVVMPSFTFVSTANAFVLRGAKPVFVDIRPDTLNMDEAKVESAITNKTKAIVPVHYAGVPCEMDTILAIAQTHGLIVVEDAAQAFNSKYKGNYTGTLGHLGCLSFHETKNIISGEGGALFVNHEPFSKRSEIIWEKGTNRLDFEQGEVDKYTWVDIGSSYLPGELTTAFLYSQLELSKKIIAKRCRLFSVYEEQLSELEKQQKLRLPFKPKSCDTNGHIFYVILPDQSLRTQLIRFLDENSVAGVFHYIPLHSSPAGIKYGRVQGKLEQTDNLSRRIIRLPLFYEMTEQDVHRVTDLITAFFKAR